MPEKNYKDATHLIYNCWECVREGQSTIAGSLLLDCAFSEKEANELIKVYWDRHLDFNKSFPSPNTSTRIISIKNDSFWWPK